jgi:hypothetical protein
MREMLQSAAGIELGDWFEYLVGSPIMDLIAAPYGGARYSIHLDVGIDDVAMQPLDTIVCRDWLAFAGIETLAGPDDLSRAAVRGKDSRLLTSTDFSK